MANRRLGRPITRRGFLAAWLAGFVGFLLPDAMAARALDDAELLRTSNTLLTLVVVIAAAGVWGAGRRLIAKPGITIQR